MSARPAASALALVAGLLPWALGGEVTTATADEVPIIYDLQEVLAPDGVEGDVFGIAVSLSNGRILVGANGDDELAGAAYVVERDKTGHWKTVAKLVAVERSRASFGRTLTLQGDRALIGAYYWGSVGTAYVFERGPKGVWSQVAQLLAPDGAPFDSFGWSVSLEGDRAMVSAPWDDISRGSVWVFERHDTTSEGWVPVTKLTASDAATSNYFGDPVVQCGDRALIGAAFADDQGRYSGKAYVFERDDTGDWLEVARLLASDGGVDDYFGASAALEGDRAVVGAPGAKRAYVFERDGAGNWLEVAKLPPQGPGEELWYGTSVSLSGDRVLVGGDQSYYYPPTAHLYGRLASGEWAELATLYGLEANGDGFGMSLDMEGDLMVVGARQPPDRARDVSPSQNLTGEIFVFAPPAWLEGGWPPGGRPARR